MQCNRTSIFSAKYSISFLLPEKNNSSSFKDNKTSISTVYNLLIYLLTLQHGYTIIQSNYNKYISTKEIKRLPMLKVLLPATEKSNSKLTYKKM